jgi:hypothetical protein
MAGARRTEAGGGGARAKGYRAAAGATPFAGSFAREIA